MLASSPASILNHIPAKKGIPRFNLIRKDSRGRTTLREKLIKTGAKMVRHSRCVTFQIAEVAVSRALFAQVLWA